MKLKAFIPILILFTLVLIAEICGEYLYFTEHTTWLLYISKPLLMPLLMYFLNINTHLSTRFEKFIFAGLGFSWLGDIFLMFNNENLFVFGLASFLIGHIFYILGFLKNIRASRYKSSVINKLILGVLPLFYLVVLYAYVMPRIMGNPAHKDFAIPVTVYALTIVIMGLFALWRVGTTNKSSYILVIAGAFTFLVSDTLIALNKFINPIPFSYIWIMITYCLGQIWITTGAIYHRLKTNQ